MTLRAICGAALSLAVCLFAGSLEPVRADEKRPTLEIDLSGRFVLNKELSDDARQRMREASERGGGSGAGPWGQSPPAPGGGPPGASRVPEAGGPSEAMRSLLEPAEEIVVSQSASEITIEEAFGRLRRLRPDGRKYKTDNGNGDIRSYWKDGKLRVETRATRGASVTEIWERVPDGSRLILMVRIEGGPAGKLELKRVYDRGEAAAISPR